MDMTRWPASTVIMNSDSPLLNQRPPLVIVQIEAEGRIQQTLSGTHRLPEVNICNVDLQTWHYRLGHICKANTQKILTHHGLHAAKSKDQLICKACIVAKHHQLPYKFSHLKSEFPLELLYTDV